MCAGKFLIVSDVWQLSISQGLIVISRPAMVHDECFLL